MNEMMTFLKRFFQWFRCQRELHAISKEIDLAWLIGFIRHRGWYWFKALQQGIQMNHEGCGDLYNLRRNIHRIEKGLTQIPPRPFFAQEYIGETVRYLEILWRSGSIDSSTLGWGKSVLNEYFRLCQHPPAIAGAFDNYRELTLETEAICPSYAEKDRPKLSVDYNAFHRLALRRRSVRHFLDRAIDFDLIKKAMETALLSPSACNRQAFRFLFVNDRKLVDRLRHIPGGAEFPIPSLMIVVGKYSGYFDERDFKVPIIDASLATMSFIYALETLGLSSVCINWPALPDRNEVLQRIILLNKDEFVVFLLAIGYPDPEAKIAYAAKRNLADMLSLFEVTDPE